MKIYRFKIINNQDKKNWKILEVPGNMNLYNFAKKINLSFGLYFDHCFCFSNNLTNPYQPADKLFELFVDIEDVEHTEGALSVKKFFITDAFKEVGDKMQYLFDYGDGWTFTVECIDNSEEVAHASRNYYKLIKSHGEDPDQYPDCE